MHKILPQSGYSIHYYVLGENNAETLLFLHPAFTNSKAFDFQIEYFAQKFKVICIDLLGHGLSAVENAKDDMESSANHIARILQIEKIEKVHLAGVSMGSLVAQYFAMLYPEKTLSLTALGGYDISADPTEAANAQRAEFFKWIFMAIFSMNSFRKHVANMSVLKPENKLLFAEMAKQFTRKSFKVMQGLAKITVKREKNKRTYPLLILCGEHDLPLALRLANKWHETEPESRFEIIPNAGHCANMDEPEVFNKILMNFISK